MPPPSPETHPQLYREMCWKVEERGAVGETTLHVCVLLQVIAVTDHVTMRRSLRNYNT